MWILFDKHVGYRIARRLARCIRRQGRRFRGIYFGGEGISKRVRYNIRFVPTDDDNDIVDTAIRLHRLSGGRVVVISWDRALLCRLRSLGIEAVTPYEAIERMCSEG